MRRTNSVNYIAHLENIEKFRRSISLPQTNLHVDSGAPLDAMESGASTSRRSESGPGAAASHTSPSPTREDGSGALTERSKAALCSARSTATTRAHECANAATTTTATQRPKIRGGTFGTATRKTFVDEIVQNAASDSRDLWMPPPSLVSFSRSVSISTASRWSDSGHSSCSGDYNPDKPRRRRSGSAVFGSSPRWQRVQMEKNGCVLLGGEVAECEGDALSLFSDDQSAASSQRTARSSRQDRGRSFTRAPRFRDPSKELVKDPVGPGAYNEIATAVNSRKRRAASVHIATAGREIEPMHSNAVLLPSEARQRASLPGPGSYFHELVWGRGGVPFSEAGKRSSRLIASAGLKAAKPSSPQEQLKEANAKKRIAELAVPKHRKNDATKYVTETALMAHAFHPAARRSVSTHK